MVPLHFSLLSEIRWNDKKKGNIRNNSRDWNCLIPNQTEYIYKKVELGSLN